MRLLIVLVVAALCAGAVWLVLRWSATPPTPPHKPLTFGCERACREP